MDNKRGTASSENAPAQESVVAMIAVLEYGFELVYHVLIPLIGQPSQPQTLARDKLFLADKSVTV